MSEENMGYVTVTSTNIAPWSNGTVLVDPATMRDGPCEAHVINERLFGQVLREHWIEGLGTRYWKCHCMADYDEHGGETTEAGRDAWVAHVLRVAAVTPEVIEEPALD